MKMMVMMQVRIVIEWWRVMIVIRRKMRFIKMWKMSKIVVQMWRRKIWLMMIDVWRRMKIWRRKMKMMMMAMKTWR